MTAESVRRLAILASILLIAAAQPAPPVQPPEVIIYPPNSFEGRILTVHNRERAAVGAPALLWDVNLAKGAAVWAGYLAQTGTFDHSDRSTRPGIGENLAAGDRGAFSVESLLGTWVGERRLFVPGTFPAVSRDGNWFSVSHYTQMIWLDTTRIGCAVATGRREDVLVCRYSPKGNRDGRVVGVPARAR